MTPPGWLLFMPSNSAITDAKTADLIAISMPMMSGGSFSACIAANLADAIAWLMAAAAAAWL